MRNVQKIGIKNPGVKIGENYTDYTQGSFRITDNTYDLALAGDGFFAIEFTNKAGETDTKYTRAGQFTLNKDGYLVTEEGDYVLDTNRTAPQFQNHLLPFIRGLGTCQDSDERTLEDYDY